MFGLAAASLVAANGEEPRRVAKPVDTRDMRVVRGNVSGLTKVSADEGRVEATLPLERVSLVFGPGPEQQLELEALLAEQRDPSSPGFQKWLTPEEYAARFGRSDEQLATAREWLRAQGLAVQAIDRSRNEIRFSGTAAQIENALRTEIRRYRLGDEIHYANATEPQVPAELADSLLAIRNLDDFRPQPRLRRAALPRFTSAISGNHFLAPDDFATIYGVQPLYAAGYDGAGQRIAVVGQTALGPGGSSADIDAFRAASGLGPANLQQVLVPGTGSATLCDPDLLEAHLDVEWAGGIAREATIVYVYTGVRSGRTCENTSDNVWDALQHAVTNNLAPVISTSYGACEAANGRAFARMVRGWVQQANAQGQTVTAASGDLGAADCEPRSSTSATSGFAVDVPAAIPEVTGVGGTEFYGDLLDPNAYWSDTNNARNGSALQYISEAGWNDTPFNILNGGGFAASGGGASRFFAKPSWQSGVGVPSDGRRNVPDVALAASANYNAYLACSQGSCVDGFRDENLLLTVVGGTSVGAPALAGVLALINQATGSSGLGNINPRLYALAQSAPSVFHDVTIGTNVVPCTPGTSGCPSSPPHQFGFSAGVGYDQVTGLGSIDAFALADAWAAKVSTATALSAPSAAIPPGASVTFTATVTPLASGFGSPVGGAVQFSLDGSDVGDPMPVSAVDGAFRALWVADALSTGMHSVGARYLGNLVYLASSAPAVALNVAGFSLSPEPSSLTLAPGGIGSSILTLSSPDGFAGTVTLSCTPPASSARVGCSLTPSSLVLSGASPSQTSTLTITTSAAPAPRAAGGVAAFTVALIALLSSARRRHRFARSLAILLLVAAGISCGGGGGGGGGGGNSGTPLGNYAVAIQAVSGAVTSSANVSLAVQ